MMAYLINPKKIAVVASILAICTVFSGCSGMNRDLVLMPLAPIVPHSEQKIGKEGNGYLTINLADAKLRISPVILSSKTTWVFGPMVAFPTLGTEDDVPRKGPLLIGFYLRAKPKDVVTVAFDPREFIVTLEDGRSMPPIGTRNYSNAEAEPRPVEPVTFTSEQRWFWLWLQYDVDLAELTPFTLRLGTLQVNGEAVHIPPISFVHGKSSRST